MTYFIKEFKVFAMRGSLLDMAFGIIIGAGFGKIVTSLVQDVIMPPIGLLVGGLDFSSLTVVLKQTSNSQVVISYGKFINTVIDFLIVAFCIFMVIKGMNSLNRKESAPVKMSKEAELLGEIRDLLKNK